tara:strand:+ start:478 stop:1602 length:1125 start_codon:yes stop_codon:yes gene_type:complete
VKIDYWNFHRDYRNNKTSYNNIFKKVLNSKSLILGPEVRNLEKRIPRYLGSKFGVGVNSCTDALLISILSLGIKKNDEIITTSNTAIPTVSAIVSSGANPVFVDIKESDYLIDENKIEQKISKKTKAIVVVHLYGQSPNMDKILKISRRHNLKIIEDCAQSFGATYKGKKLGSLGDISAISFYPTKILGTFGDGGMIVTKNKNLFKKSKMIRFYGVENEYKSIIHGLNSRLDEIQAAILNFKLKKIDKKISLRRKIAEFYNKNIINKKIILPLENTHNSHVYYNYVIRVNNRNKLIKYLNQNRISTKIIYPYPIHKMKPYSKYNNSKLKFTENLSKKILSLPIYPELTQNEQKRIVKIINKFDERNHKKYIKKI